MAIKLKFKSPLEKKAKAGFRGYPVATIAFYGADNKIATKEAVGIMMRESEKEPAIMKKWFSDKDIRRDVKILNKIKDNQTFYRPKDQRGFGVGLGPADC